MSDIYDYPDAVTLRKDRAMSFSESKRYCVVKRWKDNQSREQIIENFSTIEEAEHYRQGQSFNRHTETVVIFGTIKLVRW